MRTYRIVEDRSCGIVHTKFTGSLKDCKKWLKDNCWYDEDTNDYYSNVVFCDRSLIYITTEPQHDAKLPVVCSCLSGEFVEGFTSDGELTPIDIVAEITGLTYDEIRSCSKIVRVP